MIQPRKALIVGINNYEFSPLRGCVNDAKVMEGLLKYHEKGDPNFSCMKVPGKVTAEKLKQRIKDLFKGTEDYALFYFSGHGYTGLEGGILVTQEAKDFAVGVEMDWLMKVANQSKVKEVLIILDCCYSGEIGTNPYSPGLVSDLRHGVSVLSASLPHEEAMENKGRGVFTNLLEMGLNGASADMLGHVTPASLYHLVESILTPWQQRPVFKSFMSQPTPIRYCNSKIRKTFLRHLPHLFPDPEQEIGLSFEELDAFRPQPGSDPFTAIEALIPMGNHGLIEPVSAKTLNDELDQGGKSRLTLLGKYYHKMATRDQL